MSIVFLLAVFFLVGCTRQITAEPERIRQQDLSEINKRFDQYQQAIDALETVNKQLEDRNKELEDELAAYKAQLRTPASTASPSR